MLANAAQDLDQLVEDVVSPKTDATLDHLLVVAQREHLLDGLRQLSPSEYFRALRSGPEGDLVAATILRVLARRREAVDECSVRSQIATFLDTQYSSAFAAYYERPRRAQAFEILHGFVPVAPALEAKAVIAIDGLRVLDKLEESRERLLRLLNSAAGRVLFGAFLTPRSAIDRLATLVAKAIEMRDVDEADELGILFRAAEAQASELEAAVDAEPTEYGRTITLATVDAVREAMTRKIELKSPPAKLSFAVSKRPLPLLEPGVTCLATIIVTNEGDAAATDVVVEADGSGPEVEVGEREHMIGRIAAQSRVEVTVPATVHEATGQMDLLIMARWVNLDHTVGQASGSGTLIAHEVHIDWRKLVGDEPYALYPVEKREQLVGRDRELALLMQGFDGRPLANLYVTGQRRVGKTSLIRVLQSELCGDANRLQISSVEVGEVRSPSGSTTIGALGRKLAERLVRAVGLEDDLIMPEFDDSLAPLTEVVDRILEWDPDLDFLFVIDEFDELPYEAYRRDGPGDALFVPMRSLAQKPNVGWLLVGGEKMPFIRDEQAARLNTFRELSVSYLDLAEDTHSVLSPGFPDLVRQPLPEGFRVDDAAVRALFSESAGNPHFAKEICATLFARAVARRDAVVTEAEVDDASDAAARERDVELFVHFWEDGIFGAEELRRRIEAARRRFLTALAQLLRIGAPVTRDRLRQAAVGVGLGEPDTERLQDEFLRRGILEDDGEQLRVHVPLFARWLESEGIYKLPLKGGAEMLAQDLADEDERLRVASGEMRRLVDKWKSFTFRGQRITRDQIEQWLDQFELYPERRLAFRLLERLLLIDDGQVYGGFRSLQRLVAQDTTLKLAKGQKTLSHLYVCGLGTPGASGHAYAYKYRQANSIAAKNLVDGDKLIDRLLARPEITTVVLVDDFVGSGGTAIKAIEPFAHRVHELRARPEVSWFLFAASGIAEGATVVEDSAAARELGLHVELAHPVTPADRVFDARSTVFSPSEQPGARALLTKYGTRTWPREPLGFGECAAPVVFTENCPNNAPAILWSSANGWLPLFPRTGK